MALINRVSRLFQADLHAVLDRIEEPDLLLRQSIREMEEALDSDRRRLKLMQQEQGQLAVRQGDIQHSLEETESQMDVCFQSGKEELARGLIKRKLEAGQFAGFLAQKGKALEDRIRELSGRIEENRAHLDGMRQKADLLAEKGAAGETEVGWRQTDFTVSKEDVEVAFLREKQKRSRS